MLVTGDENAFITGNGFAAHCRYVLNYDVFRVNDEVENNWWFCNPEFLEYFFRHLAPHDAYVLFTHNSNDDRPIGAGFEKRLRQPVLVAWFATNVALHHPKLFSLPLGIANPIKVDPAVLQRVQEQAPPKTQLFEASFDVGTNVRERKALLRVERPERASSRRRSARSSSSSSSWPRPTSASRRTGTGSTATGRGRRSISGRVPIVTRSALTEQRPELPLIVLDDWSDFRSIEFSPELYDGRRAGIRRRSASTESSSGSGRRSGASTNLPLLPLSNFRQFVPRRAARRGAQFDRRNRAGRSANWRSRPSTT